MQTKDQTRSPADPLGAVQPYRSPKAVMEEPRKGNLKTLLAWSALAALLAGGALAIGYVRDSADEGVSEHVRSFGDEDRPGEPPEPFPGDGASEP